MPQSKSIPNASSLIDVDKICDEFEAAWLEALHANPQAPIMPNVDSYLGRVAEADRPSLLRELLKLDSFYRAKSGQSVCTSEPSSPSANHSEVNATASAHRDEESPMPTAIPVLKPGDRYTHITLINQGSFASVYRAFDERLQRDVALKIPHDVRKPAREMQLYLAEARILAGLQHPNIVQIYDIADSEGRAVLVSQFIDGMNLEERIERQRPNHRQAAEHVAVIADALHYAHTRGLVHRDVKPANILLHHDTPYLADFGLALTEEDYGNIGRQGGTVAYMSPEQARGEGHLVDGRSDIFSLGTVFYELLTGVRPFRGPNWREVMDRVIHADARPPRVLDETIPRELERICLKALSKRAADRYTVARDLKEDLLHFLDQPAAEAPPSTPMVPPASGLATRIVPRGLRAFEREDSDFFLDLIPGARDRDGLPQSIRFWKAKIEGVPSEEAFRIGLIYGPSGCGKTSLVKAGLIPRLRDSVISIYIDCSTMNVESRLLQAIRRACPHVNVDDNLVDTLADLRRNGLCGREKLVVFLDQVEHWLHQRAGNFDAELIDALRHCDGAHVQCILMIRDDFWLAASRFLDELEVDLLEGQNTAFVDLFDPRHASQVLLEYGRAYGCLPSHGDGLSRDHTLFIDRAIEALSQDGKIVPVRLSLFAEMIKGRPWTLATWKEIHGTEGVGERFLDETFTSGNPKFRQHLDAAKRVLKSLLPESGTNIRGTMRTASELRTISGYEDRPREFDELMRILAGDTRLLSPVDPQGVGVIAGHPDDVYYQLTHDYLVHSLRNWLTRQQQRTRRGRTEILLADRAASWQEKKDRRSLPGVWEVLRIVAHTSYGSWSPAERAMMARATRRLYLFALASMSLALVVFGTLYTVQAHSHLDHVLVSDIHDTATQIRKMRVYWLPVANRARASFKNDASQLPKQKLRISMVLAELDEQLRQPALEFIARELLTCSSEEFHSVRAWHQSLDHQLPLDELWKRLADSDDPEQIVRAASILATFDRTSDRWEDGALGNKVVRALLSAKPVDVGKWIDHLSPASSKLLPQIVALSEDPANTERLTETERVNAANAIVEYVPNPIDLIERLLSASPLQFNVIFEGLARSAFSGFRADIVKECVAELQHHDVPPDDEGGEHELRKDAAAKRKVNAAIALLRMGEEHQTMAELLKRVDDPRASSFFINYAGRCGMKPKELFDYFRKTRDPDLRLIWLKCLGGETNGGERILNDLDVTTRNVLAKLFLNVFETDPDAGLHSGSEWLLGDGRLNRQAELTGIRERLKEDEDALRTRPPSDSRRWYVSTQGLTFAVLKYSNDNEPVPYELAVSTCEITKEQFRRFLPFMDGRMYTQDLDSLSLTNDSPVLFVSWYEAAAYCNWLSEQEGIPQDQWRYNFIRDGKVLGADFVNRDYDASGNKAEFKDRYCYQDKYWEDSGITVRLMPAHRIGYALPRDREWQFACRAGANTRFSFGTTEELLTDYVCYCVNSPTMNAEGVLLECSRPVGGRLPNRFGLFDMHGNAYEWCSEEPNKKNKRLSRGGSFPSTLVRLAVGEPNEDESDKRDWKNGMRVVRRYPYLSTSAAAAWPPRVLK